MQSDVSQFHAQTATWKLLFLPTTASLTGKFPVVRCAKSCRPFELFANENCKLWSEAKMNAMFERGSARDPRRSPLSAKFDEASA